MKMMKLSILRLATLAAAMLATTTLAGCATVDPRGAFESTREHLAGRHPGEAVWLRLDGEEAADRRAAEILAAPLSPDAAAELALLRHPSLQATLEELGIAQADLAQATRLANPGVSFTALDGDGASQRTVAVFADLADWLVRPLRRRVAAAELERVKLDVGRALLDAAAEARRALLRYQAAEQIAGRAAEIDEVERAAADYAAALFAAGNLTALERAAAEAGWAESRAELRRARAETARYREAAALAMGLPGTQAWSAAAGLPPPPEAELDAAALEQTAVDSRLDLAAGRWAVDVLDRALALHERTRRLPLGAELGVESEREVDGTRLTGPTVEVRLPLFDTGKASSARLTAELARARWQLAALEAQARSEVRRGAADLAAAREVHLLYRDGVLPLRREILDQTLRQTNQMLTGTFELLDARRREIEAEQRSLEALADYWEARVELERAVGGPLPRATVPQENRR
jgi:cobalt-zinc-cadmium efflux system outer membrane protein